MNLFSMMSNFDSIGKVLKVLLILLNLKNIFNFNINSSAIDPELSPVRLRMLRRG